MCWRASIGSLVVNLTCAPLRIARSTMKRPGDRKSTRLNSSHANISYAVFCLKKKKKIQIRIRRISGSAYHAGDIQIEREYRYVQDRLDLYADGDAGDRARQIQERAGTAHVH